MNGPWRIVMLVINPVGKGTYWRAFHLAQHLAQRGHHMVLMSMAAHRRMGYRVWVDQGVQIVETPDLLWGSLRSGWDLYEALARILWLRPHRFDLVHTFEARPSVLFPALWLRQWRKLPLVMDWCDWFGSGGSVEERRNPLLRGILRPVETFFEERFRPLAHGTTVICSTLYNKAIQLGIPMQSIMTLRDGADVAGLQPLEIQACRRQLELPEDGFLLGYAGAIFYRDALLMARAFDQVYSHIPKARLILIGYMNAPVETMVSHPQAVIRTGGLDVTQLNRYLAACDVCWLPYCDSGANRGRWPLKLNDYMSVGRPTVATAVGDVAEVMRHHPIGLLCAPNPEDLAGCVETLYKDPAMRNYLGANARRVAESEFDWRLRTEELEKFYAWVISKVHSSG